MKHETVLTDEEKLEIVDKYFTGDWHLRVALGVAQETEQAILTKQAKKAQPVAGNKSEHPDPRASAWKIVTKAGFQRVLTDDLATAMYWVNDRHYGHCLNFYARPPAPSALLEAAEKALEVIQRCNPCLLYTSDAADE